MWPRQPTTDEKIQELQRRNDALERQIRIMETVLHGKHPDLFGHRAEEWKKWCDEDKAAGRE